MFSQGVLLAAFLSTAIANMYPVIYGGGGYGGPHMAPHGAPVLVGYDGGYGGGYGQPLPYKFGYRIHDPKYGGSQHREESGDGAGGVHGSYGYTDPSGVFRQVNYVADKGGFKATVHTNEPGTASQNPAAVQMNAQPIHHYG